MKDAQDFKIGDTVIVAKENYSKSRPNVEAVTIIDISYTPKQTKYHLSDRSKVISTDKMYLIR